ncbi:RNA polymerase sigma factor [Muricauda oceani]|uniref:Sigma-70 family RNA polymerase sigma factor n=1 Tax=Flagellimonas oceani TaxID=2698672 RepID=A0A6G7J4M8_9FLAO|nr:sigma-70 family RNA polymerase sigma factor [Allomuricauda oceani]MBW8242699.1 RNA polymerase sigma factor [Allomuricauda oceani]QII45558.1 sigma-70 family RNA polymerase sigma factor [Allomuricauda oceani]
MINTKNLEEMFLEHYQEWCLLSYSYVQDLDDAKDVVQTVFTKLLQKNEHTTIENFKPYINTAVRNESLKKIKNSQRTFDMSHSTTYVPSYENEWIQSEISETIFKELESLPVQNRKVFELCVIEGIKYKGAAEIMGVTVNTVKYHLKKSFKMLRLNLRNIHF